MLLEGEALFNDASSFTLFTIFLRLVEELNTNGFSGGTGWDVLGEVVKSALKLAAGGYGHTFRVTLVRVLWWLHGWLQGHFLRKAAESSLSLLQVSKPPWLCLVAASPPARLYSLVTLSLNRPSAHMPTVVQDHTSLSKF